MFQHYVLFSAPEWQASSHQSFVWLLIVWFVVGFDFSILTFVVRSILITTFALTLTILLAIRGASFTTSTSWPSIIPTTMVLVVRSSGITVFSWIFRWLIKSFCLQTSRRAMDKKLTQKLVPTIWNSITQFIPFAFHLLANHQLNNALSHTRRLLE